MLKDASALKILVSCNVTVIRWRQVEGFYNPTLITQVSKCRSVKVSYKVTSTSFVTIAYLLLALPSKAFSFSLGQF